MLLNVTVVVQLYHLWLMYYSSRDSYFMNSNTSTFVNGFIISLINWSKIHDCDAVVSRETYRLVLLVIGNWYADAKRTKRVLIWTYKQPGHQDYESQYLTHVFLAWSECESPRAGNVKMSDLFVVLHPCLPSSEAKTSPLWTRSPSPIDVYQNLKLKSMLSLHTSICDMYIFVIQTLNNILPHYLQQFLQSCCPFESVSRVTYIFLNWIGRSEDLGNCCFKQQNKKFNGERNMAFWKCESKHPAGSGYEAVESSLCKQLCHWRRSKA